MKPQGKTLAEYMASRARCTLIMGPLGSGKTFQSCQKILKHMQEQEPDAQGYRKSRWYAVRNTYIDLFGTTVKDWMELFGDLGRFKQGGMEPPTHFIRCKLPDGTRIKAELVFLALDRPEHVKKLRGAQATGFWLNEVKELSKAVIDMADLRHGRYPSKMDGGPTWHGMIGDTNAPDEDHYYYELAEQMKPEGWVFLRQPGGVIRDGLKGDGSVNWRINYQAENLHNLPDGYYVNGMQGKSDDWIAVNLANEYGAVHDGKAVYPQFNEILHVAKMPLTAFRGLPLILGWDFGRTPACIICQVSPQGQFRVLRELVSDDMGIQIFSRDVVKPYIANEFPGLEYQSWGDPAGVTKEGNEHTAFMYLSEAGFITEPARTNEPTARIEAVNEFLTKLVNGQPAFIIDPSCRMLITGFKGGYQYRRMQVPGAERYTDKPDKNDYSHPHDGLQYAALSVTMPKKKAKRRVIRKNTNPGYT